MVYCLNPACPNPENPADLDRCQRCGKQLLLGDRYCAISLLGQSSFGRTFLAKTHQPPTSNPQSLSPIAPAYCVIKQGLPRLSNSKAIALFEQEATRLAELGHHPQIPRLLDFLEAEAYPYLVQEFIRGQNLAQRLATEGPFREPQILQVLGDLLPVLQFIHERQIIHRDIKPENIICPQGDGCTAENPLVLVDFGASKYIPDRVLVQTGTVIGSAGYAAPEQTLGKAEVASDLYSLGVTCIHLLTGMHPFDLYSVSDDAWIWRQSLRQPISFGLTRILNKLLQRATSKRYSNASSVLNDLKQISRFIRQSTSGLAVLAAQAEADLAGAVFETTLSLPVEETVSSPVTWQPILTLSEHQGAITAIALSPDGRYFASASDDRSIKLWDGATVQSMQTSVQTLEGRSLWFGQGHRDRIQAVVFHPVDHTLLSGSDDGTIKQWDIETGTLMQTLTNQGWMVSALALSRDGHQLVSGSGDGIIHLWHLPDGTLQGRRTKHQDRISALLLSPDGQTLASASYDKTICVWTFQTGDLQHTLRGHRDAISAIAPGIDWLTLVSASWDGTLKVWDLVEGRHLWTLQGLPNRLHCLARSPDGRYLASGGDDHRIRVWNLQPGDRTSAPRRPALLHHGWGVNALCFTTDSQRLISGSADGTIKVWQRVSA